MMKFRGLTIGISLGWALSPLAVNAQGLTTLKTRWAAEVTPQHVLTEYPRPQMVRTTAWVNLNGSWDYAIRDTGAAAPTIYDGKILVPFAPQSQLSGVNQPVDERQWLWYHRTFDAPKLKAGERLLLHFGAVDWQSVVSVNGKEVGRHSGGYDPFTYDITDALAKQGPQTLVARVWDPTDAGSQPRGKQVKKTPAGIFYTAVTGIWQTVWLEPVPAVSVRRVTIVPDIDAGVAHVQVDVVGGTGGGVVGGAAPQVEFTALEGSRAVATVSGRAGDTLTLKLPKAHLWSPSDPFLYGLTVRLASGDRVESYFGMRKISVGKDSAGFNRMMLNNKPLFQMGMLDQGWWPDGLYTAPTDSALLYDITESKRLGFNMLRKHIKVEPERWYYYADKLGMLVWQDMPCGKNDTPDAKAEFKSEFQRIMDARRDHPSIVTWVVFNEHWGNFDDVGTTAWVKAYDPTRLVNTMSGYNVKSDWGESDSGDTSGDIVDLHNYPEPQMPPVESRRVAVLGEYGGLGLPIHGHLWLETYYGSIAMVSTTAALDSTYLAFLKQIVPFRAKGLSAAIYTQVTDVEGEVNGVMTYDRAITKLSSPEAIKETAAMTQ